MERNSIVICLCALIAFCAACTTDSELSIELKTYRAPVVLEGVIQRTDESTNSVTVRVKKSFKPEGTFVEVIDISGFGTDEPCIINADELQSDETYIFFIREDADDSFFVESNPVPSTRDVTRAVRKIACDGCAQPPTIRKKLKDKKVKEGAKFTLKCQAEGVPAATVSWTKDGEIISKGVKNSKKGSRLKIKKARTGRDDGEYTCTADNGIGQVSSSAVISICDLTCENNGDLNLKRCSCSCKDGWEGDRCETAVNVCEKTCEHGTLDESKCECICNEGYSGESCETPVCTKICGSHGTLDVLNCTCHCDDGWSGDICETSNSHLSPCKTTVYCLNGGSCYEAQQIGHMICQCKPNFMGPRCQFPKPVDKPRDPTNPNCDFCLNGGRCEFYEGVDEIVCNCPPPYTGTRCQFKDPNTVYRMMQSAKDLHTKRILTVVGVFVALLVLIIICIVAWCKARSDKNHCLPCRGAPNSSDSAFNKNENHVDESANGLLNGGRITQV